MAMKADEAAKAAKTAEASEEAASSKKKVTDIYKLSEVQAMWFLADAWTRVKVPTIKNCWEHTNILQFKHRRDLSNEPDATGSDFVSPPDEGLPLDDDIVLKIDKLAPQLILDDGQQVSESYELDLEADESDLVVAEPYDAVRSTAGTEKEVEEEEEAEEAEESYKSKRNNLKRGLELILMNASPGVDNDEELFKCAAKKLKTIKEEEISEKKQTNLLQFFTPPSSL